MGTIVADRGIVWSSRTAYMIQDLKRRSSRDSEYPASETATTSRTIVEPATKTEFRSARPKSCSVKMRTKLSSVGVAGTRMYATASASKADVNSQRNGTRKNRTTMTNAR